MLRKLNILLIVGLSLFYYPLNSKEILKKQEFPSSSVEDITEEMVHLNANLDLLSHTISNLVSRNRIKVKGHKPHQQPRLHLWQ